MRQVKDEHKKRLPPYAEGSPGSTRDGSVLAAALYGRGALLAAVLYARILACMIFAALMGHCAAFAASL